MIQPQNFFHLPYNERVQITSETSKDIYDLGILTSCNKSIYSEFDTDKFIYEIINGARFITRIEDKSFNTCTLNSIQKKLDEGMPKKVAFSMLNLERIATATFGLRHVTTKNEAFREKLYGMQQGCSLNISFGRAECMLYGSNSEEDCQDPYKNFYQRLEQNKNPADVKKQISIYYKSISRFVKSSIEMDLNEGQVLNTLSDLIERVYETTFMVLYYQYGNSRSDIDLWGKGLGRIPKTNVEKDHIRLLPYFDFSALNFSEEEKNASINPQVIDKVVKIIKLVAMNSLISCFS